VKNRRMDYFVIVVVSCMCGYVSHMYYNDMNVGLFGLTCFFIGLISKEMQYLK